MTRSARPVLVALFSGLAVLLLAGPGRAQLRTVYPRPSPFPPNRMPGWDWWRIYPYSPYNYGRNPYNPIIYPYYVDPYPVYAPPYPPVTYNVTNPQPYDEPIYGAQDSPRQVLVPHPSGDVRVPPPDAAVIRLYIPDQFGQVSFDGVKTSSIGTTRYYVTPDLPNDKPLSYKVTANFRRDGEVVSEERKVRVSPGKTSVVDFREPERATSKITNY
jgi:uncharacterized protein (TIGR03000 family)